MSDTTTDPPSLFADIIPGETPRQRLVRWVTKCNGISLSNRLPELKGLICRGVDPVSLGSWMWKTNCATSALGFMAAICGDMSSALTVHPILARQSVIGMSMPQVMQIGYDTGAIVKYLGPDGPQPKAGDLLHFAILGTNDDHVEWALSEPDESGHATTGGGGRPNNAITCGAGFVRASWARPLQHFVNLDAMNIPFVDVAPHPDIEGAHV